MQLLVELSLAESNIKLILCPLLFRHALSFLSWNWVVPTWIIHVIFLNAFGYITDDIRLSKLALVTFLLWLGIEYMRKKIWFDCLTSQNNFTSYHNMCDSLSSKIILCRKKGNIEYTNEKGLDWIRHHFGPNPRLN